MKVIRLEEAEEKFTLEDSQSPFVIPTETVYGLAARIHNEEAIKQIFKIKGRPSDNPLIVHVSSVKMLKTLIEGKIPHKYKLLIKSFWPGPLSLIFKANKTVSELVRGCNSDTVAIRMPKNPMLLRLIERLGVALAAPSANRSGRPSPTNLQHAIEDLGDRVSIYIDNGPSEIGLESTVLGIVDSIPTILRPGGVTREAMEKVLKCKIELKNTVSASERVLCPGQIYKHYSPSIPVYLFKGEEWFENMKKTYKQFQGRKVGLMRTADMTDDIGDCLEYYLGCSPREYSHNLSPAFIELDKICDAIFIKAFSLRGKGLAIMDRVTKAATFVIEKLIL